jgi:hypothetical protein
MVCPLWQAEQHGSIQHRGRALRQERLPMRARIALIIGMVLTSGMCFTGLAASNLSTDGSFFNFSAQNDSYVQVLDIFRQQTGLEYDIPPEMRSQKIPLVEIRGLTLRSALVKVLEGSNFDYILICSPDDDCVSFQHRFTGGLSCNISSGQPADRRGPLRRGSGHGL